MPTCICGRILKSKIGFTQHSRKCKKYIADRLAGGSGSPPLPDSIELAQDQLKNILIPKAIQTCQDVLDGVQMKECRIRAAIALLKLAGVDKPRLKNNGSVSISFGDDTDNNQFEDNVDDDDHPESSPLAEASTA